MLPTEITSYIGKTVMFSVFEIQKEAIRRYADGMDDPNPLYYDEDYAKTSKFGSIIAPPGFLTQHWYFDRPRKWPARGEPSLLYLYNNLLEAIKRAGYKGFLDGGLAYEFFKPVRAGDTITLTMYVSDIFIKQGKQGLMVFLNSITTYTNQLGEIVAKVLITSIHPER
jgi:acyl dehydratase